MKFGTSSVVAFTTWRPRIERERDGEGTYVVLPNGHAWLVGDRRQALRQFRELVDIERFGPRG
jgi:hypothetical protein